jgi:hypothetical protein
LEAHVTFPQNGEAPRDAGGADRAALPQFYRDPCVFDAALHGRLRLKPSGRLDFAARTNSIVLGANELYLAQAHYPIVFTIGAAISAVAVVGLQEARNLFLDADGTWQANSYVPAYVRRYPFVLVQHTDRDELTLAFDRAADTISEADGEPLVADGKPSLVVQRALDFCVAFQQQVEGARQFAAALVERKLLVENRAQVNLPSGMATALSGFQIVDETRFTMLADDVILDWQRRGWLGLVYAHLMSMHRWEALARLAAR